MPQNKRENMNRLPATMILKDKSTVQLVLIVHEEGEVFIEWEGMEIAIGESIDDAFNEAESYFNEMVQTWSY